ncbi:efflux RND transporter periplasmic adaptor subunit [Thiorhodococcus minor]|uniref:Efflux RND transporter periplasmic adaptor subunit n=1 Tax=Thiorhodococcus minor TaxID=57489 RepID=A0A6M0K010_9GAMM|nr:efflux RND transporter periplasmic adaptor subunit [Thiorhodococcus minor]NEV62273.1 efflux RND transporter periplasmic adaptor subunit [Thiorhodococcus minor]
MPTPAVSTSRRRSSLLEGASFSAVVGGLAVVVGLPGCSQEQGSQPLPSPPTVGVIEVAKQKVNPFFEFVGKTRPKESVALRARVTGFLEERAFEEGGKVEVDQVLFRIEPEQYAATVAQAEAALTAAKATLNQARVDLARYRELAETKNISQQKVDEAEARVLVEEAAVETAAADLRKTRLDLDYTEIKAPIAGRIDLAAYDVGNLVGPDSGVMATINKMDPLDVTFSIAETWYLELARIEIDSERTGQDIDEYAHVPLIKLPDGTLYEHQGTFDFFDNKVDEKTGTVLIRAEFPNPDRLLLPGQFVTVVVERREALDKVLVPQAAVLTDQAGFYVLLVNKDDKVESRRIQTGQRFGASWVVEKGLKPGERIVLYGIQKVRPGLSVKPELTAAPSVAATSEDAADIPEVEIVPEEDSSQARPSARSE